MRKPMFQLFANYNQNLNQAMIQAMKQLDTDSLLKNQHAFFGSILGTMNHLMVGDLIWLNRFNQFFNFKSLQILANFPKPTALDTLLFDNLTAYATARTELDNIIIALVEEVTESQLQQPMIYHNTKGQTFNREFGLLLSHFFNHQTHHRGQATTLLFQQGVDVGVTDFLLVIPNQLSNMKKNLKVLSKEGKSTWQKSSPSAMR